MSFLVDSDLVINGMRGNSAVLGFLENLSGQGLSVSTITLAEVFEGAFHTESPDQHLRDARDFLRHYVVIDVTDPVAQTFAELRAALRRQGNLIADMGLLIAATAIVHDLALLTRNTRHFARMPGLRIHQTAAS